jgi:hypothetical protein
MSRKHFSWLLIATFIAGAIVLILPEQTGKDSAPQSSLLLPGLEARVNDIDWLRLTAAGDRVVATLQRKDQLWSIEEASGYRADWDSIRDMLSGLARARVVEPKTENPAYYDRLGVEDVSLEGAGGVMIQFTTATGLPSVIVGNAATERSGQYVRLSNSAESALIGTPLVVSAERLDWVETTIVDVSDAEVVEIGVAHPDGESIKAVKASADDVDFILLDIPQGREIKSNWTVNALANVLADLRLDSVMPQSEVDWEGSIIMSLLTADGLMIDASMLERAGREENSDHEFWIRIEAGLYTTALGTDGNDAAAETRARAEQINKRVKGWAYRIPQYKFNAMTPRFEELLMSAEGS